VNNLSIRRRGPSAADAGMLLVCLIWGVNFSVMKLAIGQIPALPFTALRFVLASLLLWLVLRLTEGAVHLPREETRRLYVLGVVGNT
jgi:drug/metabolite transporter (DMT)-like permease